MRILNIICSTDPSQGGVIEWVRQFSPVAESLGHTVEVASMDNPNDEWVKYFPVRVHPFGHRFKYFYTPHLIKWLQSSLSDFDVYIVHGLWRYPSIATQIALKHSNMPYFVYTHGMLDPWFNQTYPIKYLVKNLYWMLTDYKVLRDAKGVIFTCENEKKKAQMSFKPYKSNGIVVPLGIARPTGNSDRQKEYFFNKYPATKNKRNILFLGRIHPKKGCDLLIKAFTKIADNELDLHLIMAGPGDPHYISKLKSIVKHPEILDRITWTSMISGDLKWGAYYACDAFILPSHQENFGISVVEAMACGKPVLISDKVDIWQEIYTYGAAMIMHDSLTSITSTLTKWCALHPADNEKMADNARRCFQDQFEIKNATTKLIKILNEHITCESML